LDQNYYVIPPPFFNNHLVTYHDHVILPISAYVPLLILMCRIKDFGDMKTIWQ